MSDMPICMGCGASAVVTYGSICDRCIAREEREEADRDR